MHGCDELDLSRVVLLSGMIAYGGMQPRLVETAIVLAGRSPAPRARCAQRTARCSFLAGPVCSASVAENNEASHCGKPVY